MEVSKTHEYVIKAVIYKEVVSEIVFLQSKNMSERSSSRPRTHEVMTQHIGASPDTVGSN